MLSMWLYHIIPKNCAVAKTCTDTRYMCGEDKSHPLVILSKMSLLCLHYKLPSSQ